MRNNADMKFTDNLVNLFRNKHLYAWITYAAFLITGFAVNYSHNLFKAFFMAFLFALLSVILEIHNKTSKTFDEKMASRTFYDIYDAWKDAAEQIKKGLNVKNPAIICLGMTLGTSWSHIREALESAIFNEKISNLRLTLLQVKPEYLLKIIPDPDSDPNRDFQRAQVAADQIASFLRRFDNKLKERNNEITFKQYPYMPTLHGVLINDSVLFLSHIKWRNEYLSVRNEQYERWENNNAEGRKKIDLFKSWANAALTFDEK